MIRPFTKEYFNSFLILINRNCLIICLLFNALWCFGSSRNMCITRNCAVLYVHIPAHARSKFFFDSTILSKSCCFDIILFNFVIYVCSHWSSSITFHIYLRTFDISICHQWRMQRQFQSIIYSRLKLICNLLLRQCSHYRRTSQWIFWVRFKYHEVKRDIFFWIEVFDSS